MSTDQTAVKLLGSKGRYGSFRLCINVWVTGKTVWSRVYTCHTWAR